MKKVKRIAVREITLAVTTAIFRPSIKYTNAVAGNVKDTQSIGLKK